MADSERSFVKPKLSFVQKFAYSVGHVLNDLTASMWFTYMIIYFHQVKNFDNGLAGNLVLIGQVSDAIFTPFIGYESDRTKGWLKLGKRKTWHLVGKWHYKKNLPKYYHLNCDKTRAFVTSGHLMQVSNVSDVTWLSTLKVGISCRRPLI